MYARPAKMLLVLLLAVILAAHVWAMANSGYFYVWWLDIVLHFAGGFWLAAIVIFFFLEKHSSEFPKRRDLSFLILVSMVSLGGILWEFFEFGYDVFFARPPVLPLAQLGQGDTMGDLFLDLLGAGVAHFLFLKNNKRNG